MSFPYVLDLAFGSEKATVDPQGRLSFGKGGNSSLPKTSEELNSLIQEGKAVEVGLLENQLGELIVGLESIQDPEVSGSLPQNYVGLVKKEWSEELEKQIVSEVPTTVITDPELIIKVTGRLSKAEYFIILKQAVN